MENEGNQEAVLQMRDYLIRDPNRSFKTIFLCQTKATVAVI